MKVPGPSVEPVAILIHEEGEPLPEGQLGKLAPSTDQPASQTMGELSHDSGALIQRYPDVTVLGASVA